jgi:hypothetical protein
LEWCDLVRGHVVRRDLVGRDLVGCNVVRCDLVRQHLELTHPDIKTSHDAVPEPRSGAAPRPAVTRSRDF